MLELGTVEQDIIKQALRTGQPLPDRIKNAPTLRFGLDFYLQAFFDLDSERQQSMNGISRIPWYAIQRYARHYELDDEQTFRLNRLIQAMDSAHLKQLSEKHG